MIKIKKIYGQHEQEAAFCDYCENDTLAGYRCFGCRQDLCRKHAVISPLEIDTFHEYPNMMCGPCAAIANPFADDILVARAAYDEVVENRESACYAACLAAYELRRVTQ